MDFSLVMENGRSVLDMGYTGDVILLEEGTENLCSFPQDLTNAVWTKRAGRVAPAANGWWVFTENTALSQHDIFRSNNIPCEGDKIYTWSVRLKKGTKRYVRFRVATNIAYLFGAVLDFDSGVLFPPNPSINLAPLPDGSFRLSITYATQTGATGAYLGLIHRDDANNSNEVYTGNGTDHTYLMWPQLEAKPYATAFVDGSRPDRFGIDPATVRSGKAETIFNNVYLSLMLQKGSFFAAPEFGSRLHLLHRAKNTARTEMLAREYCREALQWLLDTGRATAVAVFAERDRTQNLNLLKLLVEVTQADGRELTFQTFVEVV